MSLAIINNYNTKDTTISRGLGDNYSLVFTLSTLISLYYNSLSPLRYIHLGATNLICYRYLIYVNNII